MVFDDLVAARALVQTVDVLRDQCQLADTQAELRQRVVARVGLRLADVFPP